MSWELLIRSAGVGLLLIALANAIAPRIFRFPLWNVVFLAAFFALGAGFLTVALMP